MLCGVICLFSAPLQAADSQELIFLQWIQNSRIQRDLPPLEVDTKLEENTANQAALMARAQKILPFSGFSSIRHIPWTLGSRTTRGAEKVSRMPSVIRWQKIST